jgi:hypothetical protein
MSRSPGSILADALEFPRLIGDNERSKARRLLIELACAEFGSEK